MHFEPIKGSLTGEGPTTDPGFFRFVADSVISMRCTEYFSRTLLYIDKNADIVPEHRCWHRKLSLAVPMAYIILVPPVVLSL